MALIIDEIAIGNYLARMIREVYEGAEDLRIKVAKKPGKAHYVSFKIKGDRRFVDVYLDESDMESVGKDVTRLQ